jgi:cbb3-type cytochrome oxidase maturation protein
MSILYVLIPLSVILMAGAAWALLWAVDAGQFDDLGDEGRSILTEEDRP